MATLDQYLLQAQRLDPYSGWILGGQVHNLGHNIDHGTWVLDNPQQFGMSKTMADRIRTLPDFVNQYHAVKEFMFGKGAVRFWYQPNAALFEVPTVTKEYLDIVAQQLQNTPPGAEFTTVEGFQDKEIMEGLTEQFTFGEMIPGRRPSIRDIPGATYPSYAKLEAERFLSLLDRKMAFLRSAVKRDPSRIPELKACLRTWARLKINGTSKYDRSVPGEDQRRARTQIG